MEILNIIFSVIFVLSIFKDGVWTIESRYAKKEVAQWKLDQYVATGIDPKNIKIEEVQEQR